VPVKAPQGHASRQSGGTGNPDLLGWRYTSAAGCRHDRFHGDPETRCRIDMSRLVRALLAALPAGRPATAQSARRSSWRTDRLLHRASHQSPQSGIPPASRGATDSAIYRP
jgi:hypothetical protein